MNTDVIKISYFLTPNHTPWKVNSRPTEDFNATWLAEVQKFPHKARTNTKSYNEIKRKWHKTNGLAPLAG